MTTAHSPKNTHSPNTQHIKHLYFAWLLDDAAQAQFTAEIANALHVSTHLVERAYSYHGTFTDIEPFATLDAYIAAVRTTRIAEVHARKAELDAQEADYQKRRREELKLQRAGGLTRTLPTRIQPSRRPGAGASTALAAGGIKKKQNKNKPSTKQ
jgi:hypothetical protein